MYHYTPPSEKSGDGADVGGGLGVSSSILFPRLAVAGSRESSVGIRKRQHVAGVDLERNAGSKNITSQGKAVQAVEAPGAKPSVGLLAVLRVELSSGNLVVGDCAALKDGANALAVAVDLRTHGHARPEELGPGDPADPRRVDGHASLRHEHDVLQVASRPVLLPAHVLAEVEVRVDQVVAEGVEVAGDGRAHRNGVATVADAAVLRHHHLQEGEIDIR